MTVREKAVGYRFVADQDFRNPDFALIEERLRHPVIVDGRNIYADFGLSKMGFAHYAIGLKE